MIDTLNKALFWMVAQGRSINTWAIRNRNTYALLSDQSMLRYRNAPRFTNSLIPVYNPSFQNKKVGENNKGMAFKFYRSKHRRHVMWQALYITGCTVFLLR